MAEKLHFDRFRQVTHFSKFQSEIFLHHTVLGVHYALSALCHII